MPNVTNRNIIYLDTFTAAFNSNAESGMANGIRIHSIEWFRPTTTSHACKIYSGDTAGPLMCDWECSVARKGEIKRFPAMLFENIHIAISGVGSGAVTIILR